MWVHIMDSDEARKNKGLLVALKGAVPGLQSYSLDAGDYRVYRETDEGPKNVLSIESKTPSDLIISSRPEHGRLIGRLWRQVAKAQTLGDVAVLLRGVIAREGEYRADIATYVGVVLALNRNGVATIPTSASIWAVTETVASIFKRHERGPSKSAHSARPLLEVPWQVSMFAQLPNIGERRAQMLFEKVGSVEGLLEASEATLKEVLGKDAGRKLYAALREVE